MTFIHNERTKLTANWLNTMAAGAVVTGVVAPMVATFYGLPGPSRVGAVTIALGGLVWLSTGAALHFVARLTLGRLKP